jgi:hypothetical protein
VDTIERVALIPPSLPRGDDAMGDKTPKRPPKPKKPKKPAAG